MGVQGGGFISISRARLVEILIEHRVDGHECDCGEQFDPGLTDDELHYAMADHLAIVLTSPRTVTA